jgi:transcriptional regulator of acetoin/glycerol metabolism
VNSLAAGDWLPWVMAVVDSVMERAEERRHALSAEAALIISVIAGQPVESGSMQYCMSQAHAAVRSLADVAEETICTAMIYCHGDRTQAARELHISRSTLYRRLLALPKPEREVH